MIALFLKLNWTFQGKYDDVNSSHYQEGNTKQQLIIFTVREYLLRQNI